MSIKWPEERPTEGQRIDVELANRNFNEALALCKKARAEEGTITMFTTNSKRKEITESVLPTPLKLVRLNEYDVDFLVRNIVYSAMIPSGNSMVENQSKVKADHLINKIKKAICSNFGVPSLEKDIDTYLCEKGLVPVPAVEEIEKILDEAKRNSGVKTPCRCVLAVIDYWKELKPFLATAIHCLLEKKK